LKWNEVLAIVIVIGGVGVEILKANIEPWLKANFPNFYASYYMSNFTGNPYHDFGVRMICVAGIFVLCVIVLGFLGGIMDSIDRAISNIVEALSDPWNLIFVLIVVIGIILIKLSPYLP